MASLQPCDTTVQHAIQDSTLMSTVNSSFVCAIAAACLQMLYMDASNHNPQVSFFFFHPKFYKSSSAVSSEVINMSMFNMTFKYLCLKNNNNRGKKSHMQAYLQNEFVHMQNFLKSENVFWMKQPTASRIAVMSCTLNECAFDKFNVQLRHRTTEQWELRLRIWM